MIPGWEYIYVSDSVLKHSKVEEKRLDNTADITSPGITLNVRVWSSSSEGVRSRRSDVVWDGFCTGWKSTKALPLRFHLQHQLFKRSLQY